MSDYESHSGKLRRVPMKENETLEQLKKRIWAERGHSEEDYFDEDDFLDEYYNVFIEVNGILWELFDHKKKDDPYDSYCNLHDNGDGTFSFDTRYYNGGTCMREMIEVGFKEIPNIVIETNKPLKEFKSNLDLLIDSTNGKAVIYIFNYFYDKYKIGDFKSCDLILESFNPEGYHEDIIVGILCATFPVREKFSHRKQFYSKVKQSLLNKFDSSETEKILKGLS